MERFGRDGSDHICRQFPEKKASRVLAYIDTFWARMGELSGMFSIS